MSIRSRDRGAEMGRGGQVSEALIHGVRSMPRATPLHRLPFLFTSRSLSKMPVETKSADVFFLIILLIIVGIRRLQDEWGKRLRKKELVPNRLLGGE